MMLIFKDTKAKKARTGTKNARVQDHISQKAKDKRQKAQGMYMYLRAYLQILEIYSSWYYYFVAETVQLCLNLYI